MYRWMYSFLEMWTCQAAPEPWGMWAPQESTCTQRCMMCSDQQHINLTRIGNTPDCMHSLPCCCVMSTHGWHMKHSCVMRESQQPKSIHVHAQINLTNVGCRSIVEIILPDCYSDHWLSASGLVFEMQLSLGKHTGAINVQAVVANKPNYSKCLRHLNVPFNTHHLPHAWHLKCCDWYGWHTDTHKWHWHTENHTAKNETVLPVPS